MVPDPDNPSRSKQLMVLWSTKDTPAIRVSGHWWKPGKKMLVDEQGGMYCREWCVPGGMMELRCTSLW